MTPIAMPKPAKRFLVYGDTATEKDIRNSILEYLRYRGYVCKRNNSGFMFVTGHNGKKRGINIGEAGWPDIEGMTKVGGRWFGIETKTASGKLSAAQEVMKERITKSGGLYVVARNMDDVINAGL